ncbi:MAG: hypothetical protein ACI93R_000153 [Flavobacteriales bacterium]|jgi:uncharacterized protein (TIGR02466 family)
MKWSSMGLFASPLIKIHLDDLEDAKRFFYANLKNDDTVQNLTHYHSFENVFDLYSELNWLRLKIEKAGTFAYQDLLNYNKSGPMKITNAWFNLCQVGGSQRKHSHANSLLSGTIYLEADNNTEIDFFHPLTTDSLHAELYDEPDTSLNQHGLKYHHQEVAVSVQTGDCLFWPSQLRHGYTNNKTPNRLTLSFNMMPESLNTTYQPSSP